jgi:hypothetical protein
LSDIKNESEIIFTESGLDSNQASLTEQLTDLTDFSLTEQLAHTNVPHHQLMIELIGQPFFPRNIMCAAYSGFFPVNDLQHMYKVFKRSNFQDCRISAYPPVTENSMFTPNLLLLDIDYDDKQVKENGLMYAN